MKNLDLNGQNNSEGLDMSIHKFVAIFYDVYPSNAKQVPLQHEVEGLLLT
ncbi:MULTISPECIES: hypothetical protein [Methylophaga]|jgi:hypothetical protein|uniref:Uncharacterized protein n=1 Tax=Methylophaga aminisulfidivorans MP TaxID=1026882 RepID=F5T109_9GAMM|nr:MULTISPECIES: hypothetical protein [Methylophaga]EGL53905.1 hypothetical protein MAMP_00217 [Methylophaga aminisulfidivorans MP]WVI83671.1 hypothetical protein VSX76_01075 [Methylophaga thalassica]